MRPSGEDEKGLVEAYSQELIDFYEPKSSLEHLQIQRIAICRAKLSYLYELEKVKLSLASKELENQPEKVFEKIPGAVGVSKSMALECIHVRPRHGLKPRQKEPESGVKEFEIPSSKTIAG